MVLSLSAQETNTDTQELFGNIIKVEQNISQIELKFKKNIESKIKNLSFKVFLLNYKVDEKNITYGFSDDGGVFTTRKDDGLKSVDIVVGYWNFFKSYLNSIDKRHYILLMQNLKKGKEISMREVFIRYYENELFNTPSYKNKTFLISIPYYQKSLARVKERFFANSVVNVKSNILYIFYRDTGEPLPKELEGLKLSITDLASGKTEYYESFRLGVNDISTLERSSTYSKMVSQWTGEQDVDHSDDVRFDVVYRVVGPEIFNTEYLSKPENQTFYFPENEFKYRTYNYYPENDKYYPNPDFLKLWKFYERGKSFNYYQFWRKDKYNKIDISLVREVESKELNIIIKGDYPKKEKVDCYISSKIYNNKKLVRLKSTGKGIMENTLKFYLPDSLFAEEEVNLICIKPFNYNLKRNYIKNDWKEDRIAVPIYNSTESVTYEIEQIPFQFFYIDLSGFNNLQVIKDLLEEKLNGKNGEFLIYVSNGDRPIIYKTGDDLKKLFTKISLIRPEPPSKYNEKVYLKPYIENLKLNLDRRKAEFNFLFSESFLNHSGKTFMQEVLKKWWDEESAFSNGKITVTFYSTVDKPDYIDLKGKAILLEEDNRIKYLNINNIKF
jgi:hypothetical protein